MRPVHRVMVVPKLPEPLERLRELAYNLRWSWSYASVELFRRLDPDLWEELGHNPAQLLGRLKQEQLQAAAADEGFLSHLATVCRNHDEYMNNGTSWFHGRSAAGAAPLVAYFSAEFGLTECLPIFAGGLGALAGDHLKAASDLGVPMVGIGLLYQQGYFRQYLNEAGHQQEDLEDLDFATLPLSRERAPDGSHLTVEVPYLGSKVLVRVWRAQVGRVPLYLLDTNLPENAEADRGIARQLYIGDVETRFKQEIVLGIGGCRVLEALGLSPTVYHMNEGHSALLALERVRRLMATHDIAYGVAREAAAAGLVFTTHTPVASGHDRFPPDLVEYFLAPLADELGIPFRDLLGLGQVDPGSNMEPFCMTTLALRLSAKRNGVSKLHGAVSRRMWHKLWPGLPEAEVPIAHVSNGVHLTSWVSLEMRQLYDRYLGARWREQPPDERTWRGVDRIPAEELWRTQERHRERLVAYVRDRLRTQLRRRVASEAEVELAGEALAPDVLTLVAARRFAPYKRMNLLLHDVGRLTRLLTDDERPVQVIIAGKAHPRDMAGKEMIAQVASLAQREDLRGRLVFLEDFELGMARSLVQGADIWLNMPRRPLEASGTSGMKAVANGALHLSTLDGWWAEAWEGIPAHAVPIGWAIGRGETYEDTTLQDLIEAEALYALLEREVVPLFYDRGPDRVPRPWIARIKESISQLCPVFTANRMVREYTELMYLPVAAHFAEMSADSFAGTVSLTKWLERVRTAWPDVGIVSVAAPETSELQVGEPLRIQARVALGGLSPDDVVVELFRGRLSANGNIPVGEAIPMEIAGPATEKAVLFEARAIEWPESGQYGYTVRIVPRSPAAIGPIPGFVTWANGPA